mmetsp:Transcript_89641/g.252720  ORF Transcript_89641/g.252720 Transcript_89641/m.252720 type:complete len:158 (-) Transcript_89641:222-695(-)
MDPGTLWPQLQGFFFGSSRTTGPLITRQALSQWLGWRRWSPRPPHRRRLRFALARVCLLAKDWCPRIFTRARTQRASLHLVKKVAGLSMQQLRRRQRGHQWLASDSDLVDAQRAHTDTISVLAVLPQRAAASPQDALESRPRAFTLTRLPSSSPLTP